MRGSSLSEEEIEYKLNTKLMENGKFLFFRLVRYAIGNQRVQTQLKTNQNGVFIITADKWQTIMEKIDNEELQAILAHGLEDV